MSLRTRQSVNEQGPSLSRRRRSAPSLRAIMIVLALLTLGVVASLTWLVGTL
jgi:hypothetical protein